MMPVSHAVEQHLEHLLGALASLLGGMPEHQVLERCNPLADAELKPPV